MNLFTEKKDLQTLKTNLWLPKGTGDRRMDRVFGISICTEIYGMIGQHGPAV